MAGRRRPPADERSGRPPHSDSAWIRYQKGSVVKTRELEGHIRTLATLDESEAPMISCYLEIGNGSPGFEKVLDERAPDAQAIAERECAWAVRGGVSQDRNIPPDRNSRLGAGGWLCSPARENSPSSCRCNFVFRCRTGSLSVRLRISIIL